MFMQVKILKNKVIVSGIKDFDLKKCLECGQIFRYEILPNKFIIYETDGKFICKQTNDEIEIETNNPEKAINYFDLQTDYDKLNKRIARQGEVFKQAVKFGKGIRIFRQDPLEMIISFVISANNNIPRIKKSLFKLCEKFGEKKTDYFAFPTLEKLLTISQKDWENLGVGYRAKSLFKLCRELKSINFAQMKSLPTNTLRNRLVSLSGIGPKVADCVLLFAFSKNDSFPTDTWIKKFYQENMFGEEENAKKISEILSSRFGQDSGLVQQYLFYYKREKGDKKWKIFACLLI